jgi:hypothetical protein
VFASICRVYKSKPGKSTFKMETAYFSKTPVTVYQSTWRNQKELIFIKTAVTAASLAGVSLFRA